MIPIEVKQGSRRSYLKSFQKNFPNHFCLKPEQVTSVATKMKFVCLILLALALYCDAAASRQKQEEDCACDGTKVETNDQCGTILGECLTADELGPNAPEKEYFCYVSKKECASAGSIGETSRFTNKWVSYELCDSQDNDDCKSSNCKNR